MQTTYNKYARKTPEEFAEMSRKGREKIQAEGIKIGGHGWNAQTRNEKGMCREQTLAKLHELAREMDGKPTQNAFSANVRTGSKGCGEPLVRQLGGDD